MTLTRKQKITYYASITICTIAMITYYILYCLHLTTQQEPINLWELLLGVCIEIPSYIIIYYLGKLSNDKKHDSKQSE